MNLHSEIRRIISDLEITEAYMCFVALHFTAKCVIILHVLAKCTSTAGLQPTYYNK